VLTVAAALSLPAPARAQQLAVDQIELFLTPGDPAQASRVFNVSNEGNTPLQATLYTADWDRDSVGNNRFFPTGTLPRSCRKMIQIFPTQMQLDPHSSQAVRVTLAGPDSVTASCWSIVFVELRDPVRLQAAGRAVQAIVRVGTKVYVEPRAAQRSADISDMRVVAHEPTADEPTQSKRDTAAKDVLITVENTGGIQVRPNGRLELRKADNSIAATVKIEEFPLLPGGTRQLHVPIPTLVPGKYIALAILDYGGAEIAGGQVEIQMP
jgi:P pilus assembly chaperone PapD